MGNGNKIEPLLIGAVCVCAAFAVTLGVAALILAYKAFNMIWGLL